MFIKLLRLFFYLCSILTIIVSALASINDKEPIFFIEGLIIAMLIIAFYEFVFLPFQNKTRKDKKDNKNFFKYFKIFYIIDSVFMLIIFTISAFKNKQYSLLIAYPILVVGYLIIILFEKQKSKK